MDRVTSRLASAIVDVVEFCRVWDRIKPITQNKPINVPNTMRRLDHLRAYTLDDIAAISLLRSYKNDSKQSDEIQATVFSD